MKTGKILIVMIFAALGFTANAQSGVYASNHGNSVKRYIRVLDLSPSQVRDWSKLNTYFADEIYYVQNDRGLSPRAKTRKLNRLYEQKDRDLRRILDNYQYKKYRNLKSYNNNNGYGRSTSYGYRNTSRYYNSYGYNRGGSYCPSNYNRGRRSYSY